MGFGWLGMAIIALLVVLGIVALATYLRSDRTSGKERRMAYTINRTLETASFDDVVRRTREALSQEGFGVLTEIDVRATMKKKLDADVEDYMILGACNPRMAHEAMKLEPRVGAMLPCNVIVRRSGENSVEVSAIDPVASMAAIDNDRLKALAGQVRDMLGKAVKAL